MSSYKLNNYGDKNMIKKNKDKASFNVSVVATHLHAVISELKELNKCLDKTQYLMFQYMSKDWTEEKQIKVLTKLKNWNFK